MLGGDVSAALAQQLAQLLRRLQEALFVARDKCTVDEWAKQWAASVASNNMNNSYNKQLVTMALSTVGNTFLRLIPSLVDRAAYQQVTVAGVLQHALVQRLSLLPVAYNHEALAYRHEQQRQQQQQQLTDLLTQLSSIVSSGASCQHRCKRIFDRAIQCTLQQCNSIDEQACWLGRATTGALEGMSFMYIEPLNEINLGQVCQRN